MRSFRTRLIVANTVVIAVVSLLLGGALAWLNLSRLDDAINRELADRARNATRVRGPGGGPGPGFGGGGFGQRPGSGGGPRNFFNDPMGQIRRPRILTPEGESAGPEGDVPFDAKSIRAARSSPVYSDVTFQNERVRVYTLFFVGPNGEERVVQTARELRDFDELRRIQGMVLLVMLPVALLAAVGAGMLLSRSALGPITSLRNAISGYRAGAQTGRVKVAGNDEFADLARQYNTMADRVDEAFAALTESYDRQRRFVADASHEMRTPLTRIQLIAQNAEADPEGRVEALRQISESSAGLAELVRQLLDLARVDAGEMQPRLERLDLRAWVADYAASDSGEPPLTLNLDDQPVEVETDRAMLTRVLHNLVDNARRHTPAEGLIAIEVRSGGILEIRDTGEGIPADALPHVFERFYRADASRTAETGGTGLGLAIVKELVTIFGGEVDIASSAGKGTSVTLHFPHL